jgi:hypothetical protein
MLPGKIAGIVKLDQDGNALIVLPDQVKAIAMHLEKPPYPLPELTCIASGVDCVAVGDVFYAEPKAGLWINHDDPDIPELGAVPSEGEQLRILKEDAIWAVKRAG